MWWGYSPPLDFQTEINKTDETCSGEPLEVLIVGSGDARHVIKTMASLYKHPARAVTFHVVEPTLEQVARSILLLSTCLEDSLGLQESTRYFLEIFGNTLLRPATAKYLTKRADLLRDIPTQTVDCPWIDLNRLKHRERDNIEWIFKFWERATSEGVPIVEYWDRRIRKALGSRYDYRDGVFDWDFHMVLKTRDIPNLTIQEYRFWRNNGVAFTWLEGEPARSNPTLLSNIVPEGKGFLHHAYMGDITNGPYFTWALNEESSANKLRATDVAEREVMRVIHEIRTMEPMCDELAAAHRDPSILNGIIVTEMPGTGIEQDSWDLNGKIRRSKEMISWVDVSGNKVVFHPVSCLNDYKNKAEFINKFDVVWLAHNMTRQLSNLVPLVKKDANILIESRKFMAELRKEDLRKYTEELRGDAKSNGLRELKEFDAEKHMFARFSKL